MRLGIIDLGSNSVRFTVYGIKKNVRRAKVLHREKIALNLGREVFSSGCLSARAIDRTAAVFVEFRRTAFRLHTASLIAVATSAVREAENGLELLGKIKHQSGIDLRIISGLEEAELITQSVMHREQMRGLSAVVDIGGGSTEISICHHHRVIACSSFPFGAARHVPGRRIRKLRTTALKQRIRAELLPVIERESWPLVEKVFASSGTMKALLAPVRRRFPGKKEFKAKTVAGIAALLAEGAAEMKAWDGVPPWRIDTLPTAAVILAEVLELLGAQRLVLSKAGVTQGILLSELHRRELETATRRRVSAIRRVKTAA